MKPAAKSTKAKSGTVATAAQVACNALFSRSLRRLQPAGRLGPRATSSIEEGFLRQEGAGSLSRREIRVFERERLAEEKKRVRWRKILPSASTHPFSPLPSSLSSSKTKLNSFLFRFLFFFVFSAFINHEGNERDEQRKKKKKTSHFPPESFFCFITLSRVSPLSLSPLSPTLSPVSLPFYLRDRVFLADFLGCWTVFFPAGLAGVCCCGSFFSRFFSVVRGKACKALQGQLSFFFWGGGGERIPPHPPTGTKQGSAPS